MTPIRRIGSAFGKRVAGALFAALACAAPMAAHAQSLIRDAEIESYLREYADPIFAAAGLQPKDVDLYLVNDPSIQAFVSGGQKVFVFSGLIIEAEEPGQIKGVLAHETCHIACGHGITRMEAAKAGANMSLLSIGLGVLAMAAGAPDAGMAILSSGQQFGYLTFAKHTRTEESVADQEGVKYMMATHQSAEGLLKFFEKFRYQELMSERRREPYFQTHPISSDRIGQLRAAVAKAEATALPQSPEAVDQLARMKAKLVGFLQSPAHVARKYPKSDLSIYARYARAISDYRAVDITSAMKEVDGLIALEPDNPYFQELKGQIYFESGKVKESIEPNRESVALAPQAPLLKVNLARSLIELGTEDSVSEAVNLLIDSLAQERDNAFGWNQLARAYAKQGKIGDADLATAEEAYSIGDMQRAHIFATRASMKLDLGTPNGRRASDISAVTDPKVRGRGAQRSGFNATSSLSLHVGADERHTPSPAVDWAR